MNMDDMPEGVKRDYEFAQTTPAQVIRQALAMMLPCPHSLDNIRACIDCEAVAAEAAMLGFVKNKEDAEKRLAEYVKTLPEFTAKVDELIDSFPIELPDEVKDQFKSWLAKSLV